MKVDEAQEDSMLRGTRRHERGAAAVEMAILLPLLILIIGGIIDFGRFFMVNAILTNAASEGTRYASVSPDRTLPAEVTKIQSRAAAAAEGARSASGNPATAPTAAFTDSCSANNQMRVAVTTQFNWLMLNAIPGISNPKTLTSTSVIGC